LIGSGCLCLPCLSPLPFFFFCFPQAPFPFFSLSIDGLRLVYQSNGSRVKKRKPLPPSLLSPCSPSLPRRVAQETKSTAVRHEALRPVCLFSPPLFPFVPAPPPCSTPRRSRSARIGFSFFPLFFFLSHRLFHRRIYERDTGLPSAGTLARPSFFLPYFSPPPFPPRHPSKRGEKMGAAEKAIKQEPVRFGFLPFSPSSQEVLFLRRL